MEDYVFKIQKKTGVHKFGVNLGEICPKITQKRNKKIKLVFLIEFDRERLFQLEFDAKWF